MIARFPAFAVFLLLVSCGLDLPTEEWAPPPGPARPVEASAREACAQRDSLRRPLYGDLHVHTAFSMDARVRGTLTTPDQAYRFARGMQIPAGRIDRPLDFAAVTDHAEWLSEVALCARPKLSPEVYASASCQIFRGEKRSWLSRLLRLKGLPASISGLVGLSGRSSEVCGRDRGRCRRTLALVWGQLRAAAERHYDRSSACTFTSFHAWEYSRSPDSTKIHRNVILRSEVAPEIPFSWLDTPTEPELRRKLRDLCLETGSGCDAIAIPHNPNLSNGQSLSIAYLDLPLEEQREHAALQARLEPIVEMMQIKGESECRNGMFQVLGGTDELCGFEKTRDMRGRELEDCEEGTGSGALAGRGCISRMDHARYALIEGLREEARIDINPLKFGFIGSTDTHRGTPGAVAEYAYRGKFNSTPRERLTAGEAMQPGLTWNPGGLAAVWAEENTREAIFDAMKRREAFATSGPRISARFFGSWSLPADWCERPGAVEIGYAQGVPMGGDLGRRPAHADAPVFAVSALRDPGTSEHPGGLLQRIQIIKGWVGDDGGFHQQVTDVAGRANDADVDLETCTPRGAGAEALCALWTDPSFDADQPAVYYARVVENPSCRWSTWQCLALPEDARPDGCRDPRVPKTIQERAWTSPIWVSP